MNFDFENMGCLSIVGLFLGLILLFFLTTLGMTWLVTLILPILGLSIAFWDLFWVILVAFIIFRFLIPTSSK